MASGYIPLPAYRVPSNAMLDFSGVNSAIDQYGAKQERNAMLAYQQQRDRKTDARAGAQEARAARKFSLEQSKEAMSQIAGIYQQIESAPEAERPMLLQRARPMFDRLRSMDPEWDMDAKAAGVDPSDYMAIGRLAVGRSLGPQAPLENKPTDDIREFHYAQQNPAFGQFLREKKPSTMIDMKQEGEYEKTIGKQLAEEFVNAQKSAGTAQRDIGNLNVMRSALDDPNLYTGTGGAAIQALKKGAQTLFGVEVKGVASGELMQNLASEIAVGNREKLPGPMSDADRQFLVEMAPTLSKTPEGNRLIIELGIASKTWQVARAKAASEYAARNGGRLDPGFYQHVGEIDNALAAEMSGILEKLRGMGAMAPRSPAVGTPLPEGWSIKRK